MSRYMGNIKVVATDLMCWPVCPKTLQAFGVSCYDPWAWKDPEVGPLETITETEWLDRVWIRDSKLNRRKV